MKGLPFESGKFFGGLVPWNRVWRTGAGYNTKISFDKQVKVGGQQIEAGTYALYTIPQSERMGCHHKQGYHPVR